MLIVLSADRYNRTFFLLTVKVATLIFILGCVSSFSSAKEGISGSFILVKS